MSNTTQTLKSIVLAASTAEVAVKQISEKYVKISNQAAKKIQLDIQDHIEGKMSEEELTHWVSQYGL